MNPVNQVQMKDFATRFELEHKNDSEQFELYCIYSIINGGSGENVDPFDIHLSGTEFGLDGVAIVVQGTLVTNVDEAQVALDGIKNPSIDFYFFQSKTSSSFDYGEISKFFDGVKGFFNGQMAGESDQLDDLMLAKDYLYEHGVKKENPGIFCFYCSTGKYNKQDKIEKLVAATRDYIDEQNIFNESRISLNLIGAGALQKLYRAASTASEISIEVKETVVLPSHPSVDQGYIGYIPATELLKIVSLRNEDNEITGINKSVFYDNIRDYNPASKINKEISQSLANGEGENFVYRNNGITVVAKSIGRVGNTFNIDDFQVVNGCQTSNVIFDNRDNLAGVCVPFRLIGTKDEEFIFSIISGTNKQNPVREEQFWSLIPFMKNLEEYARGASVAVRLYIERRENQYKSESIERARIIAMQPFLKTVAASLLGAPHRAARNYKSDIKESIGDIFDESDDVRPCYAVAYLHYRLEFLWRNQKVDSSTKIYRYYIIDAVCRAVLGKRGFASLSAKEKTQFSEEIIKIASSEGKLSSIIKNVKKILDNRLKKMRALSNREKLRDTIRSESFFIAVRNDYMPSKPTLA